MLSVRDLEAGYASRQVLHGVSLDVAPGQLVAVLGPNGAGKTTLIRALTGRVLPRRGQVTWQGRDLLRLSPRARARLLAVIPQNPVWPPDFTVAQAVLMGRTAYMPWWGQARPEDWQHVRRALAAVGLQAMAHRPLAALSGGERQRVWIARALAQDAPVLLFDEPTTHLDWRYQLAMLDLARAQAHRHGRAVLVVLHDLNQAAWFADQIVLLQQGRVVAAGPPRQVLTPERIAQVYGVVVEVLPYPDRPVFVPTAWDATWVPEAGPEPRASSHEATGG
ncbi:MAG: ABC transporter ATP-binding protein [Chloroflexi bacterium]|nr:ABC transporter ATP-binding protein [Chloroflexota bacterium]